MQCEILLSAAMVSKWLIVQFILPRIGNAWCGLSPRWYGHSRQKGCGNSLHCWTAASALYVGVCVIHLDLPAVSNPFLWHEKKTELSGCHTPTEL